MISQSFNDAKTKSFSENTREYYKEIINDNQDIYIEGFVKEYKGEQPKIWISAKVSDKLKEMILENKNIFFHFIKLVNDIERFTLQEFFDFKSSITRFIKQN